MTDCEILGHPDFNLGACPCGLRAYARKPRPGTEFINDPWVHLYDPRNFRKPTAYGRRKAGPQRPRRARAAQSAMPARRDAGRVVYP